MRTQLVTIPSIADPIKGSPGFAKKELSTYKLDIMGLCGFGCSYCSSNEGNYLRINRKRFAKMTAEQTGEPLLPATSPALSFRWGDFEEQLRVQVDKARQGYERNRRDTPFGTGHTLVFSQLTDAFSPWAVADGLTERTLDKVLRNTGFRVRILTKSAVVGTKRWIRFFNNWRHRVVVGLSIGTLDDAWARRVEIGTSSPAARVKALRRLQDAGIPTFGMLCPVFPHVVQRGEVAALVEAIRPERCETIWAEPYNDRNNWVAVATGCDPDEFRWFRSVFGMGDKDRWSRYAEDLYREVARPLATDALLSKLRYLLYEGDVTDADAHDLCVADGGLKAGILLQGPKGEDKLSKHPVFREAERRARTA